MATVTITLTGDTDYRILNYELRNNSASDKFLNVWQRIFQDYNGQVLEFDFECPTPTSSEQTLQYNIHNICKQIITDWPDIDIPACWRNVPYNQTDLNVLHDKFAENTQLQPDENLARMLCDLNFAIHELEAKIMNQAENFESPPYISSCSAYKVEADYSIPLTESDAQCYDAGFKYQNCMIIGYNTLGKDLQALAFDNDINSMKNSLRYVPKTDIKSQFSIIVPEPSAWLPESELNQYRHGIQQHVTNWAIDNNSIDYGIDPADFKNFTGRMIIGYSDDDIYEWIMQQSGISMHSIRFEFGVIKLQDDGYRLYSP
jgi:hypothetical protein